MRYPPEHKASTRQRLLETGGAIAKKSGFGTTGIDSVMAAAGLTSGAFYGHFKGKSELFGAIVEHELEHSLDILEAANNREELLSTFRNYVSAFHVEHPEQGCALPAISAEVARADDETRNSYEKLMLRMKDHVDSIIQDEATAWALLAQVVGAVAIARAMASQKSRKNLLKSVNEQVARVVNASSKIATS